MAPSTTPTLAPSLSMPDLDFHHHATNYATHGLHAFAAKCPPPLAAWIIQQWSQAGDHILDPMAGSGTTLVEAQLLGREGLAVEIDPLARLLCLVKTTPLPAETLERFGAMLIADVESKCLRFDQGEDRNIPPLPEFHNRDYWFLPDVSAKLALIKQAIAELPAQIEYKRLFYLAFSSLILARTSVANARDIVHSRHHYYTHRRPPDVAALFRQRVTRMSKQMRAFSTRLNQVAGSTNVRIVGCDARQLPIEENSVDLVVTSPPYCNALDYTRAHGLAVAWLSDVLAIDPHEYMLLGRRYIGTDRASLAPQAPEATQVLEVPLVREIIAHIGELDRKKGAVVQRYFADMWQVLREVGRVLRPDAHAALVVCPSNIRKVAIPTHRAFEHIAGVLKLPDQFRFEPVFLRERTINDRRRLMPYIGMEERMRTEYVLVFKKVRA